MDTPLESLELRSDPLYVKVYALLRTWILEGRLPPGERLRETTVAADLQVSRTPVRDALRRLEQDRLIVAVTGAAYEVYRPAPGDLADLYFARSILEGGAARLAAEREPAETFAAMDTVLGQMEQAYSRPDTRELLELDRQFHELLVAASGNPVLVELHVHLRTRLLHLRRSSGNPAERRQQVMAQHAAMIAALRAGDGAAAEQATRHHILSVYAAVRASFTAAPAQRT